jgi:DNA-binding NarL/FixJ family response regulator
MASEHDTVSVALVHPLRMWVHALEAVITSLKDVEIVVAHTDPRWARIAAGNGKVDVVLLGLGGDDGVEQVRDMREACPGVGVVVISDSDDAEFISSVVRAGARGYLPQNCSLAELLRAIHALPRGETWMRPHHVTRLVEGLLCSESSKQEEQDRLMPLSAREREVLECLALGMHRQEIAARLFLSPNTVRTHIHHVLRKLDVHSTLAAVSLLRQVPGQRPPDENQRHYSSLS